MAEDQIAEQEETAEQDETESVMELLVQLGQEVSALVFWEVQLEVSRNMPQVRRAARDVAGALVAGIAFFTAFVFANVAALRGLSTAMSDWGAALVLGGVWIVVAAVLSLALMTRARNVTGWKWWRVFTGDQEETSEEVERARAAAEQAVRDTLGRLAPVITIELAKAAVPDASDVVDVGEDLLDSSEEIVEAIAEDLPGGGIVNQVWDVVLMPGRFGLKVATTVFSRGDAKAAD